MGHIFCLMGKSASGKDTVFSRLINDKDLALERMVPYTTRPMRSGETDGVEYHFTDIDGLKSLRDDGRVIEERCYHTIHGDWHYFTVDDVNVSRDKDYLLIGTLEVYEKLVAFYGGERVVPLYIEIDDGERLQRALQREKSQDNPKYAEMCRRYLADCEDFSEEKIALAGIVKRYDNSNLEECIRSIKEDILSSRQP